MRVYKTAIVGCGRIGSEFDKKLPTREAFSHAGAYYLNHSTKLIAACDSDPSRLKVFKEKWAVQSVYPDYRTMLNKENIDILSICTPASSHLEIVKFASGFPVKAIYCEKPISVNSKTAKEMIRICRDNNILLIVNHQRRFGAFYQELKDKLQSGDFGNVQQVNCYYTRGIYNTCTHIIDLFSFLFGKAKRVDAKYSGNRSNMDNDPNLDAVMEFKNGLDISLKGCDDLSYLILEIDILTDKARICLGETIKYYKAVKGRNLLKCNELKETVKPPFRYQYPRYGMVPVTYGVKHIIDCLNKRHKPLSKGEDAVATLAIIEALLLSAKTGKSCIVKY